MDECPVCGFRWPEPERDPRWLSDKEGRAWAREHGWPEVSTRTRNALLRAGYKDTEKVRLESDEILLEQRNLGLGALREIRKAFNGIDLPEPIIIGPRIHFPPRKDGSNYGWATARCGALASKPILSVDPETVTCKFCLQRGA